MAHERAKGKQCPVSSSGVGKSRRSAAPQRSILCSFIHAVSQEGKVEKESIFKALEIVNNSSLPEMDFKSLGYGSILTAHANTRAFTTRRTWLLPMICLPSIYSISSPGRPPHFETVGTLPLYASSRYSKSKDLTFIP